MTLNDFVKLFTGNKVGELTHELSADGTKINQRVVVDSSSPVGVITRSEMGAIKNGAKSGIGTEVTQITENIEEIDVPIDLDIHGVEIIADDDNTGSVYVGINSDITAGTDDNTDGIRLKAGNSIYISTDNLNKVYLIGSGSNQKIYYLAV